MSSGAHHKKARWISVPRPDRHGRCPWRRRWRGRGRRSDVRPWPDPPRDDIRAPSFAHDNAGAAAAEVDRGFPVPGATNVAANAAISLRFSAPLAAADARPTITPATKGTWSVSGATLTFTPLAGWVPLVAGVIVGRASAAASGAEKRRLMAALAATLVAPGTGEAAVNLSGVSTALSWAKEGARMSSRGGSAMGVRRRCRLTAASPVPGATDVVRTPPSACASRLHWRPRHTRGPTITPATKGTWSVSGATLTFTPLAGWVPYSSITVSIPAGLAGSASRTPAPWPRRRRCRSRSSPAPNLRLEQLLAELGYLPVTFTPTGYMAGEAAIDTNPPITSEVTALPVAGVFSWRFAGTPASLTSQWVQGEPNVILRGAVMAFESTAGLASDGVAGPQVWRSLLAAVAARQVTKQPYNYLMVSEARPETLQVWSDGVIIASTLANTGISEAPTAPGTFPVYARYASTTMTGTNPDGSHYSDPGVLWVAYFNGGDAVHQFPRPGYGYPQSLGCVELPSSSGETVWGMDPIGTLVTVS